MKNIFLAIFRILCYFYPFEYGKYTILTKYYFPYLAPNKKSIRTKKIKNKIRMELDITEYLQAYLYLFGNYESQTIKFLKKYIHKGNYIFDVGANIGYMSLLFSKFTGPEGKIFAFEPETNNFSMLQKNILLNNVNNIFSYKVACSENEEELKLYLSEGINKGQHTLLKVHQENEQFEIVKTIKLDDFFALNHLDRIDLIKIDVEGAELEVLKGMDSILTNYAPILVIEVVSSILAKRNLTAKDFCLFLKKYNYHPYKIRKSGNIVELKIDDIGEINDNIVFKK